MPIRFHQLAVAFLGFCVLSTSATLVYVDLNGTNPTPPYTNWVTAATNIQDAIDGAKIGDVVLVTNGIYRTGGRVVYGALTNRIAVTKPITVQSVNGPAVTAIEGYQMPVTPNGDSAVRCVYLTNGAALVGFSITNGATRTSGDQLKEKSAGGIWCHSVNATISNCVVVANAACQLAGGVYNGALYACTLTCNTGVYGGAICYSKLRNCALTANSAIDGGAAYYGDLINCTITGNSAVQGGGAYYAIMTNCVTYYNQAALGANFMGGTLSYCCATPLPLGEGNIESEPQLASVYHIAANSPCRSAGHTGVATGLDIDGEAWLGPSSIGCDEYQSDVAVGLVSPSIQQAFTSAVTGASVPFIASAIGRARYSVWDFGDGTLATNRAYIYHKWLLPGDYAVVLRMYNDTDTTGTGITNFLHAVTNMVHYVASGNATPASPFVSWDSAATNIQDAVDAATTAGALILVSNGVYGVGGTTVYGTRTNRVAITKPVVVRSLNGPAFTAVQGYQLPGAINGESAVRCVYLGHGAVLDGFTLTNGATGDTSSTWFVDDECGGGVWCASYGAIVSNCVLTGNSAYDYGGAAAYGTLNNCTILSNTASYGGATYFSTLNGCVLNGNRAEAGGGAFIGILNNCLVTSNLSNGRFSGQGGGGAHSATLNNCTVTWNLVSGSYGDGGGAYYCTLNNCILYYNSLFWTTGVTTGSNYCEGTLNYCCTSPLPPNGTGNIDNTPAFVNGAVNNSRLASTSPCINAANNAYVTTSTDLDSNPRIKGGSADIGAYEFQSPASAISYAWLQQYGLATDDSMDFADPDVDGMNNWQEWICGTDPTNPLSMLNMLVPVNNNSGVTVSWESARGKTYFLQRSTNFLLKPTFSTIQSSIVGQAGTTSFTDTNADRAAPYFYRVGVQQ